MTTPAASPDPSPRPAPSFADATLPSGFAPAGPPPLSTPGFDLRSSVDPDGSIRIAVVVKGGAGPVGSFAVHGLSLEEHATLLSMLAHDPPSEPLGIETARTLASAAALAEEWEVPFTSSLGEGSHEVFCECCDLLTSHLGASDFAPLMTLREVRPGILHVEFESHYLMTSTFLRAQEHYESPEFKGRAFSLAEFKTWYAASREHGEFSYYLDWDGFNIPGASIDALRSGRFDPLSAKEEALLSLLSGAKGRFYVIGTAGTSDPDALRHEIAHGMYCVNDAYRAEVDAVLSSLDLAPIEEHLESLGYHPGSWRDECHAYLGDSLEYLEQEGIDVEPYRDAHDALLEIYARHSVVP